MEQKNFLQRNWGWIAILVVIVLICGWFVSKYNSFIVLGQDIDGQWAQVENQFQRRFDLIPNLEASVKGALKQEKDVFGAIAAARTQYAGAKTTDEKAIAAGQVESALGRLLVITENYPQLASLQNIKDLMVELEGTENRIAVERGKYNDKVKTFNSYVLQFPTNLVATLFGVKQHAYFNAPTEAQTAPKVNLTN
ncbi:MAG: LemA family protein [bacterium]